MKTGKLFMIAAFALSAVLVCGTLLIGCSDNTDSNEGKTSGELYVIGSSSAIATRAGDKTDLVFTGDDIVSFNALYGEIIFTESKFEEIRFRINLHTELLFFIGDNPVFNPPIQIHYGWGISDGDCDLQFRTDGVKTYLTDIYMYVDSLLLPQAERETLEKAMEANKQKRKIELDVLIEYFSDAGKITEQLAPLPEEPECNVLDYDEDVIVEDTVYVKTYVLPKL